MSFLELTVVARLQQVFFSVAPFDLCANLKTGGERINLGVKKLIATVAASCNKNNLFSC